MQPEFLTVDPSTLSDNPFELIGKDWMLITAGTRDGFNTMTASWGGVGVLWARNVCFCFIRPGRHTRKFMESSDLFTLSFFDESHRDALTYCGSHSGRDKDKVKETGLTPVFGDGGVYFAESRLVFCCRKLYHHDIDPARLTDLTIDGNHYPLKDYHRMYVGEIVSCLKR
jgi:flavin reductase (DIM6/NTAB) family NADH-FMN oxidoreductase RutF